MLTHTTDDHKPCPCINTLVLVQTVGGEVSMSLYQQSSTGLVSSPDPHQHSSLEEGLGTRLQQALGLSRTTENISPLHEWIYCCRPIYCCMWGYEYAYTPVTCTLNYHHCNGDNLLLSWSVPQNHGPLSSPSLLSFHSSYSHGLNLSTVG